MAGTNCSCDSCIMLAVEPQAKSSRWLLLPWVTGQDLMERTPRCYISDRSTSKKGSG